MKRTQVLLFLLLLPLLLFYSCKKDLLRFHTIQKLQSYTTTDDLSCVKFLNDTLGFIVGGQRTTHAFMLQTKDGGYTWHQGDFVNTGKSLFCITQSPSGIVYFSGYDSKIIYSEDTGRHWFTQDLPIWKIFTDITYPTATQGIAIGGISYDEGWLVHLNQSGQITTWDSLPYQLNKIKMADEHIGYICGYGTIIKTTDGGQTWLPLSVGQDNFYGIDILSPNSIWVCGYGGSIIHSTDEGATWQKMRNGNDFTKPAYYLRDIVFKDAANGWAVGDDGLLIHTDDAGNHWEQYDKFTSAALRSIAICKNGDLIVCGDNGSIYRLSN